VSIGNDCGNYISYKHTQAKILTSTAVLYKVLGRRISVYYCCKTRRYCLSSCYVYMYIHLYTSVYVYRYKYEGEKSVEGS